MLRLANRVGQSGVFKTGTPDYVDVDNSYSVGSGLVSFATKAADTTQPGGAWADGDTTGILVYKDLLNWQVWVATWDATNEYLELDELEDSAGTLENNAVVTVSGVPTAAMLDRVIREPQIKTIADTTYTVLAADKGYLLRFTSGSAVTVTLDDDLPVGFHFMAVQEGAGLVSFARDTTDEINGATANVDMAGQWKSAYVYKPASGDWVALV